MRDDSNEKSCIPFSMSEVQPATNPAEAQVEEEKRARPFVPAPTEATERRSTRPWPCTLRPEPAISLEGPGDEAKLNLCYMFGTVNAEGPVEKARMASSLVAIISEDSLNSNLATLMGDSGASGHHSTMPPSTTSSTVGRTTYILIHPARFSLPGELCWKVRRKACCKVLSPTITGTKFSLGSIS